MTAEATSAGGRWPGRGRVTRILLLYVWWLALCPHVVIVLAVAAVNHLGSRTGEYGSVGLWLLVLLIGPPCALYRMPVAAVLGEDHLQPSSAGPWFLVFGDLAGHAQILIFYTFLALAAASIHLLLLRSRPKAEPDAAPDGGSAASRGNPGATEGPPSVS